MNPGKPEKRKILVATPLIDPSVTSFYVDGMLDMYARPPAHTSFKRLACFPRDIVRARSRLLRQFLADKECTHVLYVDGDNVPNVEALRGMLDANKGVVACPYPRREFHPQTRPGDMSSGVRYSVIKKPGAKYDPNKSVIEILGIGFGFTLISREAATKLVAGHTWKVSDAAIAALQASNLPDQDRIEILGQLNNTFEDDFPGNNNEVTVALFSLYNQTETGSVSPKMLGEDYSFCARCRDSGVPVWMYVGRGSPVEHDGMVRFTGNIDDVIHCATEKDQ